MQFDILAALHNLPASLVIGLFALFVLLVLCIPLTLRVAGLTGQQIADLLSLTMQFFINLAHELRAQNKGQEETD